MEPNPADLMTYKHLDAEGGTRTRTGLSPQRILSPLCLPFHHPGIIAVSSIPDSIVFYLAIRPVALGQVDSREYVAGGLVALLQMDTQCRMIYRSMASSKMPFASRRSGASNPSLNEL